MCPGQSIHVKTTARQKILILYYAVKYAELTLDLRKVVCIFKDMSIKDHCFKVDLDSCQLIKLAGKGRRRRKLFLPCELSHSHTMHLLIVAAKIVADV